MKSVKHAPALLIVFIMCTFLMSTDVYAGSSSIDKLTEIKKSIKSKLMKVKEDKRREESIQTKINKIDRNIGSKEKEIKGFERGIENAHKEINALSDEITSMTSQMASRKKVLKEYIRSLHKKRYESDMIMLVSAHDYQDFIKKSRYVSLIADHNSKVIGAYKEDLSQIEEKKKSLETLQAKLESDKALAYKKKKKLQSEKNKKGELAGKIRQRRLAHEKKIKELEKSSERLAAMVTNLKSKTMPSAIIGQGFKSQKGTLPWPVNGKVVSKYGKQKDSYDVEVNKSGINIAVERGEGPKAIAGGRVVFAGKFDGYGNMIIIDHGNGYHSLYGNLTESTIQESVLLIEGMDVGSISDQKNTPPVLYFEIRHRGRPVDPLKWLQRRS